MELWELPESIFVLIVAWLPLIDALRLCSLSKQWLNLWIYTKFIEIDQSKIIQTDRSDQPRKASVVARRRASFVAYVRRMLPCFIEPELHSFRLKLSYLPRDKAFVDELLGFAVTKKAKELHLDFSNETTIEKFHRTSSYLEIETLRSVFHVPNFLNQGNDSLRVLSLSCCSLKNFSFQGYVDQLISLSLKGMFITEAMVNNIGDKCSVLEELSLVDCRIHGVLRISSGWSRLKGLVVKGSKPFLNGLEVFAPKTQYLEVSGVIRSIGMGNLEELYEVAFDIENQTKASYGAINIIDLLLGLKWVRVLTLTHHFLKVLTSDDDKFRELPLLMTHLKHLIVKTSLEGSALFGVLGFIRSSPHLNFITIQSEYGNPCIHEVPFSQYRRKTVKTYRPSRFPYSSLRAIKFEGFLGNTDQMNLLEFLLRNALFLEKVFIFFPRLVNLSKDEISSLIKWTIEELEKFEHAPPQVEVVFQTNTIVRSSIH